MKRSDLNRKTPLRRTNFRKASKPFSSKAKGGRKRIRQDGKRRDGSLTPATKYREENRDDREEWRDLMPQQCMMCGLHEGMFRHLEVHEIERKGKAGHSWADTCNYLLLCAGPHSSHCHQQCTDSKVPHAHQLALKYLRDRKHFKLKAWLAILPRGPQYVTMREIRGYLREIEQCQQQ